MSVTLYEPGLIALFTRIESEASPLALLVAAKAQQVVLQAQDNVQEYFGDAPSLTVDQDVTFVMEGATATVGIIDNGSKSRRLARYQSDRKVNWLLRAKETVFPADG